MILCNYIIRLLITGYLQFVMNALINLQKVLPLLISQVNYSTSSDAFSSIFSIILLAIESLFPALILLFLYCFFDSLDKPPLSTRASSLFLGLRTDAPWALVYNTHFCVRRLIFALICVNLTDYPTFQVQILLLQSLFSMIYLGAVKPFQLKLKNMIELMNELTILASGYHLYMFTDFLPNEQIQYHAGYSLILIIIANLMMNIIVICINVGKKLKEAISKNFQKLKERFSKKSLNVKKYALKEQVVESTQKPLDLRVQLSQINEQPEESHHSSIPSPPARRRPPPLILIESFQSQVQQNQKTPMYEATTAGLDKKKPLDKKKIKDVFEEYDIEDIYIDAVRDAVGIGRDRKLSITSSMENHLHLSHRKMLDEESKEENKEDFSDAQSSQRRDSPLKLMSRIESVPILQLGSGNRLKEKASDISMDYLMEKVSYAKKERISLSPRNKRSNKYIEVYLEKR